METDWEAPLSYRPPCGIKIKKMGSGVSSAYQYPHLYTIYIGITSLRSLSMEVLVPAFIVCFFIWLMLREWSSGLAGKFIVLFLAGAALLPVILCVGAEIGLWS